MENWQRTVYICALGVFLTALGLSQVAPIMPLYFRQLGIPTLEETATWSGLAIGITFIVVAVVSPLWGRLADRKGRKLMLLRASLGMMITNILASMVTSPEQLVLVRMAQGLVSGFYSAAVTLVATQVPKDKTGQSLGLLAAMSMAGALVGPIIGGYLAGILGIRQMFLIIAACLFIAFLLTWRFVQEDFTPVTNASEQTLSYLQAHIPDWKLLLQVGFVTFLVSMALLALQPIMTIYVETLLPAEDTSHLALLSGIIFSVMGFTQMASGAPLGRLADRIGPNRVAILSLLYVGILTIPQGYASNLYELVALRFLMGLGLGGLVPAINTYLSTHCPKQFTGQVFSYNQSVQFLGYFFGSCGGSLLLSVASFTIVFWATGLLFIATGLWMYYAIGFRKDSLHM